MDWSRFEWKTTVFQATRYERTNFPESNTFRVITGSNVQSGSPVLDFSDDFHHCWNVGIYIYIYSSRDIRTIRILYDRYVVLHPGAYCPTHTQFTDAPRISLNRKIALLTRNVAFMDAQSVRFKDDALYYPYIQHFITHTTFIVHRTSKNLWSVPCRAD